MNFNAYIQRQKDMIRQRNGIEEVAVLERREADFAVENKNLEDVPSSERLFWELDNLKGLNVRERMGYAVEA